MVRFVLGFAAVIGLCVASARADDQKKADKRNQNQATGKDQPTHKGEKEAKITNVDAKKGTVTVEMTDKNGKKTGQDLPYDRGSPVPRQHWPGGSGRPFPGRGLRPGGRGGRAPEADAPETRAKAQVRNRSSKSGSSNSGNKPPSKP